jgi:hypothetical protein
VDNDLAGVRRAAVFPQVDALHVPRANAPSMIGMLSEVAVSAALI